MTETRYNLDPPVPRPVHAVHAVHAVHGFRANAPSPGVAPQPPAPNNSLRCSKGDVFLRAFSLIEVALAVGIIAFAVIAILALFGTSLQSSRQVVDEDEALGVARALPAYLQTVGFATVYHWIQSPATAPALYSYTILPSPLQAASGDTARQSVIYSGSDPGLTAPATTYLSRTGALFAIQLRFSADMPIHSGTAANAPLVAQPAISMLPPSDALYPESALAIRAAIYPVSAISLTGLDSIPAGAYPAFIDDTIVSR